MKKEQTPLEGCYVLFPEVFEDERGFFFESFNTNTFTSLIKNILFTQNNLAESKYGVIRGLHMQLPPYSQSKLIQVLVGNIIDVAVDVRKNSKTFGQSFQIELSAQNKKQLFVPKGFLHGYSVLSKTALVNYKCDEFYYKDSEIGINPLDEKLNIDWKIPKNKILLSKKDKTAKPFSLLNPVII